MNIENNVIQGYCKNKCRLQYNYPDVNSACVMNVHNDDSDKYLSVRLDEVKSQHSVIFNDIGYAEHEIRVYSPSLHLFNGKRAAAEVCIFHSQINGAGSKLIICVPVMKSKKAELSDDTSSCAHIINMFAETVGGCGDSPKISATGFTPSSFIPRKPYFYYTNDKGEHVVVFHTTPANTISPATSLKMIRSGRNTGNRVGEQVPLFYSGDQYAEKNKPDVRISARKRKTKEGFMVTRSTSDIQLLLSILLLSAIGYSCYRYIRTRKPSL